MRTKIISAFPGMGKTFYHNKHSRTSLDIDSNQFNWVKDKLGRNTQERNPDFPQNYIDYIKRKIGRFQILLVSSHKEVREALKDNCIFYHVIYPSKKRKREFIRRYRDKGSSEAFIDLVESNWDDWIEELRSDKEQCKNTCIVNGNLSDILENEGAKRYPIYIW